MNKELLNLLTEHQFYHVWGCVCGWADQEMKIEHTEHLETVLTIAGYTKTPGDYLINRVEVIDGTGRALVEYVNPGSVYLARQDDNRTLKVFISERDV